MILLATDSAYEIPVIREVEVAGFALVGAEPALVESAREEMSQVKVVKVLVKSVISYIVSGYRMLNHSRKVLYNFVLKFNIQVSSRSDPPAAVTIAFQSSCSMVSKVSESAESAVGRVFERSDVN